MFVKLQNSRVEADGERTEKKGQIFILLSF